MATHPAERATVVAGNGSRVRFPHPPMVGWSYHNSSPGLSAGGSDDTARSGGPSRETSTLPDSISCESTDFSFKEPMDARTIKQYRDEIASGGCSDRVKFIGVSAGVLAALLDDHELMNLIESQTNGDNWAARESVRGRGFRLHNTSEKGVETWQNTGKTAREALRKLRGALWG